MIYQMTDAPWLTPGEQIDAIERLLGFGIIKFDNARKLKLKMGGTTDIYVNLRDARNHPEAIRFVSGLFENPLRRLHATRFAEIPQAVTCFAGPLSLGLNLPYITIRESEKKERATTGLIIGEVKPGDLICVFDDVTTDGESKVLPLQLLRSIRNVITLPLVVLVDRQQGWKQTFAKEGLSDVPVWAGMTLHDIRKFLITEGIMKRCESEIEQKNTLIVALDNKPWEEILPLVDVLRTTGTILKVNDLIFELGFEKLVEALSVYGRVMVDIKAHDIPNTVANICKRLVKYQPWAVTVHSSGNGKMVKAAVQALKGTGIKVLAVTVLTSFNDEDCREIFYRHPADQVDKLAKIAFEAGADGVVCSPQEAQEIKLHYPQMITVTPGIRAKDALADDQSRTATLEDSIGMGSDFQVIGREILNAADPVKKVAELLGRIAAVRQN